VSVLALDLSAACKPTFSADSKWLIVDDHSLTEAGVFCKSFSSNTSAVVISSGKKVFGLQSAIFVGTFASPNSCFDAFAQLLMVCYGSDSPTKPVTLGGNVVDPGGANLVVSFGNAAQF
jgi:hypothetical protein